MLSRQSIIGLLVIVVLITFPTIGSAQWFPTYINGQFTLGNASGGSPYALADTFFLESNPGASKTIYLDFDGHHSANNTWNHNIQFDPFDRNGDVNSFTASELIEIQQQFQNVAEDFLPFDVNVTTRDPGIEALRKSNNADTVYGVRAVNTQPKGGFGNGIGGIAMLDSFNDVVDNPVFTFNKGNNNGAITNSHEVGHALGLIHDGLGSQEYHPGTGSNSSPVSWGPIMGAPFNKKLVQWSNGDYANATTQEDDVSIITKTDNGFGFRPDLVGDTIGSAKSLTFDNDGDAFDWGIIETRQDVDMFEMNLLTPGTLDLTILPFQGTPNLDVLAKLYGPNGTLLATSNPISDVDAAFQWVITTPGLYYVSIEGTGNPGIYSDYGSLGFFSIEGSFSAIPEPSGLLPLALVCTFLAPAIRRRRKRLPGA